jgi:hypothetical protein
MRSLFLRKGKKFFYFLGGYFKAPRQNFLRSKKFLFRTAARFTLCIDPFNTRHYCYYASRTKNKRLGQPSAGKKAREKHFIAGMRVIANAEV